MKKNAKRKPVHRKKKKVSGTAEVQEFALRLIGVGAGAVAGAFVIQAGNTALAGQTLPAWVIPAGVAGVGAVLPLVAKKNALAEDFGMGMLAVGGLFTLNETFLSVPGISGLAFANNSPGSNVMKKAVGCSDMNGQKKVGGGTGFFLNNTVGARRGARARKFGALMSD
jgi:hypothetical protein